MGCPAFPFIDQGNGWGYMSERKRERRNRRKRKSKEKECPRAMSLFFPNR
jgi:hypothetical protein